MNGQGISLIERMRIIVIRRTWRICPDRKSGLFWGSESSLTRKPSPTNCLDVRHTVVHDFERLIDGPLFGSLLGEPLIEAPTSERLFLRRSAQVHPEGVVAPTISASSSSPSFSSYGSSRSIAPSSAECEGVDRRASIEEFDLEETIGDWTPLADQLVHPRVDQLAGTIGVDIAPRGGTRRRAVDRYGERHGRAGRGVSA